MTLKAVLWDVDGTLAETERDGHRVAFNRAFEACGLPWRWSVERYGELLAVAGGRERLLHDMASQPGAPGRPEDRDALARGLHQRKNALYAELVQADGIALRPGVRDLLAQCRARGIRMAITTTTSRSNVDALLRSHLGAGWAGWFAAQVCGEDVLRKKPDPEAYRLSLDRLGLAPGEALALEDSPAGAASALAAGVPVVVARSVYFEGAVFGTALAAPGLLAIGPGLGSRTGWMPQPRSGSTSNAIGLDDLMAWHATTPDTPDPA
jgi:HAD superfamily hydrolase (TIGR01509 family)